MARWAVFDIDGTLLPGTSLERLFIRYCIRERIFGLRNLLGAAGNALRAIAAGDFIGASKGNKAYLRNCSLDVVHQAAATFADEILEPRLSPAGLDRIGVLREEGHRILLLSGSPDFLAELLNQGRDIDHIIATQMAVSAGHFTGTLCGLHPYGAAKKELLQQVAPELAVDFQQSIVFANHETDAEHMRLFAQAVAVNPTPKLRRIAAAEGWGVTLWDGADSG